MVRQALTDRGITHREFAFAMGTKFCGSTMWKLSPSRHRLARVAKILEDDILRNLATSDLYWDRIVAIDAHGHYETYEVEVPGGNLVANSVSVGTRTL